ncbi:uncharacterized protein LOC127849810 [Dreissena polymorpha]|uniref:uncharacterized protein LOC127849810 n=1 Tax=Dreissena polymorpha TaxID=45954 RepID=UPI0022656603|nr:uncharacterized protein LOC127849810 [Dreissena polymorpha]
MKRSEYRPTAVYRGELADPDLPEVPSGRQKQIDIGAAEVAAEEILEQSHEWNRSLYVVFVYFEKAFDRLHRDSLWKILRHYGIPQKLVNVIRSLYENFECRVIHNNQVTEPFKVETGVKQGCILLPLLFSMAID